MGYSSPDDTAMTAKEVLMRSSLQPRLLRERPLSDWVFVTCFALYVLLCVFIYFHYVEPWISGETGIRIGADSDRLWNFAKEAQQASSEAQPLISATSNLLGPVSVGMLLRNGLAVMCFNFFLFGLTMKTVDSIPGVNSALVGFLLLLNAELLPALATLNKEIFALLASVLTVKYLYSPTRSRLLLAAVFLVSAFARWEQVAILILYFLLRVSPFKNRPWLAILFLIAAITVIYPVSFQLLGIDPHAFDWLMQGATTQIWINNVQDHYGFFLLVVPKILLLITGELHSPQYYDPHYWRDNFSADPQNMLFLPLACLAFTLLFAYGLWTKRMTPSNPVAFLSMITLIVIAAAPFTQPRYIFGVYAMLCIEVARPRMSRDSELARRSKAGHPRRPVRIAPVN
jgi:hypothetical protein